MEWLWVSRECRNGDESGDVVFGCRSVGKPMS